MFNFRVCMKYISCKKFIELALRIIEADEMIFLESPLIIGPAQYVASHFCFGCSAPQTPNKKPFISKFHNYTQAYFTQHYFFRVFMLSHHFLLPTLVEKKLQPR